jgi:DNA invertase Pin-like site-specific DNA recombinase
MAAFVYCRQSDVTNDKRSSDDADTLSLESQLGACRTHAEKNGWAIAGEYTEQFSGFSATRPQYVKMRRDIKNNHKSHKPGDPHRIDQVIIYTYARLSRDPNELTAIVGLLKSMGVSVEPTRDQKLDSGKLDPLIMYVSSFMGKMQVEDSVEHAKIARQALTDKGLLVCSGRARYGYKYDTVSRTRVIDGPAAAIVRKIFGWFVEGYSAHAVMQFLQREGIRSPSGNPRWALKSIRDIIRDPSYKGEAMRVQKTARIPDGGYFPSGGRKFTASDKPKTVGESTPAIVTPEVWDSANDQTRKRSKMNFGHGRDWLVGRVHCTCGVRLCRFFHSTRHYWYWRCPNHQLYKSCHNQLAHANDKIIRDHTVECLARFLNNPDIRTAKLSQLREKLADPEWAAEAERNQREITSLKSKMAKLFARFGDDDDLDEMLSSQIGLLKEQLVHLEGVGRTLAAKVAASRRAEEGVDQVRGLLATWPEELLEGPEGAKVFNDLPEEDKRLVVQTVGLRVDVAKLPGIPQIQVQVSVFDYEFLSAFLTERLPIDTSLG